jgi:hypothetical protein
MSLLGVPVHIGQRGTTERGLFCDDENFFCRKVYVEGLRY